MPERDDSEYVYATRTQAPAPDGPVDPSAVPDPRGATGPEQPAAQRPPTEVSGHASVRRGPMTWVGTSEMATSGPSGPISIRVPSSPLLRVLTSGEIVPWDDTAAAGGGRPTAARAVGADTLLAALSEDDRSQLARSCAEYEAWTYTATRGAWNNAHKVGWVLCLLSVFLVVFSCCMAWYQLCGRMHSHPDPDSSTANTDQEPSDTGADGGRQPPPEHEVKPAGEAPDPSKAQISLDKDGGATISVESSVVGVILLVISFLFLYLYVRHVFPHNAPRPQEPRRLWEKQSAPPPPPAI